MCYGSLKKQTNDLHRIFSTTSGVNFTNILRATFTLADPKSAKKTVNSSIDEIDPRSQSVMKVKNIFFKFPSKE